MRSSVGPHYLDGPKNAKGRIRLDRRTAVRNRGDPGEAESSGRNGWPGGQRWLFELDPVSLRAQAAEDDALAEASVQKYLLEDLP